LRQEAESDINANVCAEIALICRWEAPIPPLGGKKSAMERQTVSIMKACEMVGVSRRTIYNWIAAGKVEYVRTAGGSIRIFQDSLWRQPDGDRMTAPNTAA
jgi:excisionase family DNA binding protein